MTPLYSLEPKILYRAAVEHVPNRYYTIPSQQGRDHPNRRDGLYGRIYTCALLRSAIEKRAGVNVELIDFARQSIHGTDRLSLRV